MTPGNEDEPAATPAERAARMRREVIAFYAFAAFFAFGVAVMGIDAIVAYG